MDVSQPTDPAGSAAASPSAAAVGQATPTWDDDLGAARQVIEIAERHAERLREEAARRAAAMLAAARAEIERMAAEARAQDAARSIQNVSWDAAAETLAVLRAEAAQHRQDDAAGQQRAEAEAVRIVQEAQREAAQLRQTATEQAQRTLDDAQRGARAEAASILQEARRQAETMRQQAEEEAQCTRGQLVELRQRTSALVSRLLAVRQQLGDIVTESPTEPDHQPGEAAPARP